VLLKDGKKKIVIEDFKNAESINWGKFNTFYGGGDVCEDVIFGFKNLLNLKWEDSSKFKLCVFISDCPSHGKRYYGENLGHGWDHYPDDDKKEKNLEFWIKKLAEKNINLFIVKITDFNDIMNKIIEETYQMYNKKSTICHIMNLEKINDQEELNKKFMEYFETCLHKTISTTIIAQDYIIKEPEKDQEDINTDSENYINPKQSCSISYKQIFMEEKNKIRKMDI